MKNYVRSLVEGVRLSRGESFLCECKNKEEKLNSEIIAHSCSLCREHQVQDSLKLKTVRAHCVKQACNYLKLHNCLNLLRNPMYRYLDTYDLVHTRNVAYNLVGTYTCYRNMYNVGAYLPCLHNNLYLHTRVPFKQVVSSKCNKFL